LPEEITKRGIHLRVFYWLKIAKNNTCKACGARLRFALFLGKTLKSVACLPQVETIDLWQLKFA
jgi:hypothetical protein